jgi:purine nucleosidase
MTPAAEFNIAFDPEAAHIVLTAFPQFELVDWEATVAHGLPHEQVVTWLEADSPRAQFFRDISRKTREWSVDRRGNDWFAADALAMAHALYPQGATELALRPLAVELEGRHTRGATVVDWQREHGGIDTATILMRYDQSRFEELIRLALAAG